MSDVGVWKNCLFSAEEYSRLAVHAGQLPDGRAHFTFFRGLSEGKILLLDRRPELPSSIGDPDRYLCAVKL